jgi:L-lactate dehydrogenase (cytochrome)
MNLKDCHNFADFRKLAKKKLPSPIFHYIDGAADDEVTYARNTSAFDDVDLVPNVLRGVENVDLSTTIFGKKIRSTFLFVSYRFAKIISLRWGKSSG